MRSIVLVTVLGLATTALAGERRYALIHHGREREAWQVDQLKAVRGVIVDDLQSPRLVMVRAPSKRSTLRFLIRAKDGCGTMTVQWNASSAP